MQIQYDFPLSEVLWYKIGGKAKYFLTCTNRDDIKKALEFVKEKQPQRIFTCGQGSNLIFTDEYFDGAVIQIVSANKKPDIVRHGKQVTSFAGETLDSLILFSLQNNLTGLEWAGGLPGTVGAGIRGNVGAFGGEVKDSLLLAEVFDYSESMPVLKTLTNKDLQFVYRGSLIKLHKKMIVISATFDLKQANVADVTTARNIYERNIQTRRDRHPLEYPNCGSVFKNLRKKEEIEKVLEKFPDLKENVEKKWYGKVAVASLIERLGFKGYRIGNAQVSEKHALFIINLGGAKANEVLKIIHDIQEKFMTTFGFTLEVEVEVVK